MRQIGQSSKSCDSEPLSSVRSFYFSINLQSTYALRGCKAITQKRTRAHYGDGGGGWTEARTYAFWEYKTVQFIFNMNWTIHFMNELLICRFFNQLLQQGVVYSHQFCYVKPSTTDEYALEHTCVASISFSPKNIGIVLLFCDFYWFLPRVCPKIT